MKLRTSGFSLLEMIGVMAVMAILAGALAPSVFQMLERGYQDAEQQSISTVAAALQDYVLVNKTIPTENINVWTVAVAGFAALPPQRVQFNEKNFQRRLYVDPVFFTTSAQTFPGYTQTVGLAVMPNSPRAMLVSNLQGNVSAVLDQASEFDDVWNQSGTPLLAESNTLIIERINLAPLFKRLVLSNSNTSQAGYILEAGTEGAVAAGSGTVDGTRSVVVLRNSRLSLNAAPFPGGVTQRQLIVSRDLSLRYESDGSNWFWSES